MRGRQKGSVHHAQWAKGTVKREGWEESRSQMLRPDIEGKSAGGWR